MNYWCTQDQTDDNKEKAYCIPTTGEIYSALWHMSFFQEFSMVAVVIFNGLVLSWVANRISDLILYKTFTFSYLKSNMWIADVSQTKTMIDQCLYLIINAGTLRNLWSIHCVRMEAWVGLIASYQTSSPQCTPRRKLHRLGRPRRSWH